MSSCLFEGGFVDAAVKAAEDIHRWVFAHGVDPRVTGPFSTSLSWRRCTAVTPFAHSICVRPFTVGVVRVR